MAVTDGARRGFPDAVTDGAELRTSVVTSRNAIRENQGWRYGTICGLCGTPLGDDATIYRYRSYRIGNHTVARCERCIPERYLSKRPRSCGGCGRPVVECYPGSHWLRYEAACSAECREAAQLRRRRARRSPQEAREKTCETCGESFTAPRSDARYCSSPCRQRAYRLRAKEEGA